MRRWSPRNRKVRIALVLTLAIVAAFVAWRTGNTPATKPCEPGRKETRDPSGKVIQVTRTTCLDGD